MSLIHKLVDERFLNHRRRSTSLGGIAGGVLALGLFAYRFYVQHQWSGDLLAVGLTIVAVKVAAMAWYLVHD